MNAGKGSKPRPYNKGIFDSNYSEINWDSKNIVCSLCSKKYKRVDKTKYMVQDDSGNWKCIDCNK